MTSNTPHHIAAIGPQELISGFQSIGIMVFPAVNGTEALAQLATIRSHEQQFACVCITESIMRQINPDDLTTKDSPLLPVILTIPDLQSDKDAGLEKLRELTKRAIGSDIFSN